MIDRQAVHNLDPNVYVPLRHNAQSLAARDVIASKTDQELLMMCDKISQDEFGKPFSPENYPWLNSDRESLVEFIICSFL